MPLYKGYENYIDEFTKNHPEIYLDIFSFLEDEYRINELIELGKKVLNTIDRKLQIGSDIALYLANIDIYNKESYAFEAFIFKPNALNLLRIINNGYYKKYENDIKNRIVFNNDGENDNNDIELDTDFNFDNESRISKKNYYLLQFFLGNFETFYNECIKNKSTLGWTGSFIKTAVFLWLLLLNNSNEKTKSISLLLSSVFLDIGYDDKNNMLLDNDIYKIWDNWKNHYKLDKALKDNVIKWLDTLIENRVEAIMAGNYRKSYDKAALLVVGYAEMLDSQGLGTKEDTIKLYINKYSRRSAFRAELNEFY